MMVPWGTSVTLYEDNSWSGRSMTWVGQPFNDGYQEMSCINFKSQGNDWKDFDDKTSSAEVYRTGSGLAKGTWKQVASGNYIKLELTVGFTTTKSTTETESEQFTLSYEMTSGMEFAGASSSRTIKESYTKTLEKSVTDTFTQSAT